MKILKNILNGIFYIIGEMINWTGLALLALMGVCFVTSPIWLPITVVMVLIKVLFF